MWDTSCRDWEERLLSGRSLVPTLPLFEAEAAKALRVFKRLHIPDVPGRPRIGDVAGPWLFPIVAAIFGSLDVAANQRMIQEFFWLIAKKNSKTSTAAAIGVTALIVNRRPEGEISVISTTKEVSGRTFLQAANTIRCDDELMKLFQIQDHQKTITHRLTGATLKVQAADTSIVTGGKQVVTIIDEIHVLAEKQDADQIMLEIKGALAARPDGFVLTITTQSKTPPRGVFKAALRRARAVRDGRLRAPLLPILYELPKRLSVNNGWRNRKLWPLVNPNLNRSVSATFLEAGLAEYEMDGKLALFASQHFNVEVGVSLQDDGWPGARFWEAQADSTLTLDSLIERSDVIALGGDGGGLADLLALAAIGRERVTGKWLVWVHAWMHKGAIAERKSQASRIHDFANPDAEEGDEVVADVDEIAEEVQKLEAFISGGDLTIVDKMDDAYDEFVAIVENVADTGLFSKIGLDPVGVNIIVDKLARKGITQDSGKIEGISQGYKLQGIIKSCEAKLSDGDLVHAGQPIMDWCVGNAKVEQRGNAILITKQASGVAKIDPLMAMFDAAAIMLNEPEPQGSSIWDRSDLAEILSPHIG